MEIKVEQIEENPESRNYLEQPEPKVQLVKVEHYPELQNCFGQPKPTIKVEEAEQVAELWNYHEEPQPKRKKIMIKVEQEQELQSTELQSCPEQPKRKKKKDIKITDDGVGAASGQSEINLTDEAVPSKVAPSWKINNLGAAQNPNNYDCIEYGDEIKIESSYHEETLRFSTKRRRCKQRRLESDMRNGKPGPKPSTSFITQPVVAFDYFFPLAVQQKLTSFVNKGISKTIASVVSESRPCSSGEEESDDEGDDGNPLLCTSRNFDDEDLSESEDTFHENITSYPDYTITEQDRANEQEVASYKRFVDLIEFRAFLGLWFFRAMFSATNTKLTNLYSDLANPIFTAVMTCDRFKFIMRHLNFDGVTDLKERREKLMHDRLAAFRFFFEAVNDRWAEAMLPDMYLTIDDTLYKMHTQVDFKTNNNKQQKKGLLMTSVRAVTYPYTYTSHIYAGRPSGTPNQFYVSKRDDYAKYLINRIAEKTFLSGRNLTLNRFYCTSVDISRWLWDVHDMTIVGTFKSKTEGFPPLLKKTGKPYTSEIYYEEKEPLTLCRYNTPTKNGGKSNVVLLTTRDPIRGVTKDKQKKPAIFKFYDFTRAGTDAIDCRYTTTYCSKPKTERWTIAAFSYVMDTTRVNSQTLVALNNGQNPSEVISYDFGIALATQLVKEHLERRPLRGPGVNESYLMKLYMVTKNPEVKRAISRLCTATSDESAEVKHKNKKKDKPQMCPECRFEIMFDPSIKDKTKALCYTSKSRTICEVCSDVRCNKHLLHICRICSNIRSLSVIKHESFTS